MTIYEEIWRNMKKYVDILDLALPYLYGPWDLEKFRAPPSYSLWDLEKFRILPLYMGLGTWKNSTPELPPRLWDLEKFRVLPLYRLWNFEKFDARPSSFLLDYGTCKNSDPSLCIGSKTYKNSELHPRLWDFKKFWALPLSEASM